MNRNRLMTVDMEEKPPPALSEVYKRPMGVVGLVFGGGLGIIFGLMSGQLMMAQPATLAALIIVDLVVGAFIGGLVGGVTARDKWFRLAGTALGGAIVLGSFALIVTGFLDLTLLTAIVGLFVGGILSTDFMTALSVGVKVGKWMAIPGAIIGAIAGAGAVLERVELTFVTLLITIVVMLIGAIGGAMITAVPGFLLAAVPGVFLKGPVGRILIHAIARRLAD